MDDQRVGIRRLQMERDAPSVLALINADRLPGQPECTQRMLAEAVAGESSVDAAWWTELEAVTVDVATTSAGVVGVVSYATRPRDGVGIVLWLHAAEDPAVVAALLNWALERLSACAVVEAFDFASALGLGLEALPVRHRPVTHARLLQAQFVAADLWRYMVRRLPAPDLPHATGVHVESIDGDRRHLTVLDGDTKVAEATVGAPVAGIGVLWWINVEESARGSGLGRALLGSALDLLSGLGAGEVILFVDDDEPGGERDRTAASNLYDKAGFEEVDRLHSYRLVRPGLSGQLPQNRT